MRKIDRAEMFRVICPYCKVGSAVVDVSHIGDASQASIEPRRCELCARYFAIKVRVHLYGAPLETVETGAAARQSIRRIVGAE